MAAESGKLGLTRIALALLAAVLIGIPVGIAMGLAFRRCGGILGSDNRVLSSGAAIGLFAADGDLVWY